MKVVINKCYGGFGLSKKAYERLIELGMTTTTYDKNFHYVNKNADIVEHKGESYGDYSFVGYEDDKKMRTDKRIIQVIEELGSEANGEHAELHIIDIPFVNTDEFTIEEYDGLEHIAEKHETWY